MPLYTLIAASDDGPLYLDTIDAPTPRDADEQFRDTHDLDQRDDVIVIEGEHKDCGRGESVEW